MKDRQIKNIAASVRQRLLNVAKDSGRPFQEFLQYFAMERFLYRLTRTPHSDRFVLKGALMMTVWQASALRPTKDIDLLGHMPNRVEDLIRVIQDACRQEVEPDGLIFDPDTVTGFTIKEDADYEGVRVTFRGLLQNTPLPMQIDVGFGDVVFPTPVMAEYPVILDHPAPRLRGYARETAVAEKFEAMVKLGVLNSRMKDFYDVWLLSRQFDFDGATLATSIEKTFAYRGTDVSPDPTAFSEGFASDQIKTVQWRAFRNKSRLMDAPEDFKVVVEAVAAFLSPPAAALVGARSFGRQWQAPGPWSESVDPGSRPGVAK